MAACKQLLIFQKLFLILLTFASIIIQIQSEMSNKVVSVDFEVFGKVQGVFFRKSTATQANKLGIKGWCRNTEQGTVEGNIQGEQTKIMEMKHWLANVGSKGSKIVKADFKNEKELAGTTSERFQITR